MLSFLLAIIAAAAAAYYTWTAGEGEHWGWAILACFGAALVVLIPINLIVRKKLNAIFMGVQNSLMESQKRLQLKANTLVQRGQGTPKLAAKLEEELAEDIKKAMIPLEGVRKYNLWNPLASRQADMLKAQLYYQIKDYDSARPLMEKAFVVDPSFLCMKLILQWKKAPEDIAALEKIFRKNISRFKYEKGKLAYATYSWLLVKQEKLTEAVTLLAEAKKQTEDPVIAQNWEHLANNRVKRFSNAGLGEQWYALGLEQPAAARPVMQDRFGGRPRGGFRR